MKGLHRKDSSTTLEWTINLPNGATKTLEPECGVVKRTWFQLRDMIVGLVMKIWKFFIKAWEIAVAEPKKVMHGLKVGLVMKIWKFFIKAWEIAVAEPKKVMHGLKVGLALTVVSIFYYIRPLYDSVGGNAMWAVMTVVVVFEYTVGATLGKSINRAIGTFLAGSLALGVQYVAKESGERFEPIILGISVFLLASAATFSRFIPSVKQRFDYGAMIFILTFSLVAVSGYRVEELFALAQQRLSTIAIGTSLCILISMLFAPIWAGDELHNIVTRNLEKLSDSLDGSVAQYFKEYESEIVNMEEMNKRIQGYKCVLNSKANEDSMANFATWEPAHGRFNFRHPWKQYIKVAATMRSCAYCIETLNGCVNSEIQVPDVLENQLGPACLKLSSDTSTVLEELAVTMKTMTKSTTIDLLVADMNFSVQELQNGLKSLPPLHILHSQSPTHETSDNGKADNNQMSNVPSLMLIFPLATLVSLIIEIAARVEGVADMVDELANLAEFKVPADEKLKQNQQTNTLPVDSKDHGTVKAMQNV